MKTKRGPNTGRSKDLEHRRQWDRDLRKRRKQNKICTRCGKSNNRYPKTECSNCAKVNTIRAVASHRRNFLKNKPILYYNQKLHTDKLRADALMAYGDKCNCCGETTPVFLTIDHVAENGSKHLTPKGRRYMGTELYRWLKHNNYPEGFQVLCWNCNLGKHILGRCPHQQVRGGDVE